MRLLDQNNKIIETLKNLYSANYEQIKDLNYKSYVSYLIDNNQVIFDKNTGEQLFWMDEFEIKNLIDSLKNFHLSSLFEATIKMAIDEEKIKIDLKNDLISILFALKNKNLDKFPNIKRQALFITYGDFPQAWCCMYGEGNFPILKEPTYFNYDYSNELFIPDITLDYSKLWKDLINLEKVIDENDLYNQLINESEKFRALINTYVYKTYLLLNEIFEENKDELFKGFPIKKPFYVFANQHDCEPINLFIIE
jgi:hypothetical protein